MTFYWIYDIPNWALGVLTVVVFNAVAVGGLYATRPLMGRLLGQSSRHNDVVSYFFAGVGVFYGLALGLIAVATWGNFTGVDSVVGKEGAALAALYRDLDGYAPTVRAGFENSLRNYTQFVIEKEWPEHREGRTSVEGSEILETFEDDLMEFDPKTEREKVVHAEVLRSFDDVTEQRRLRLEAVTTGLPASLWTVVLIGALLNVTTTYLFWVENRALHVILLASYATLVALLVFLTAAMDNPFRGDFSISPDAIRDVLDTVMKPPPVR